MPRSDSPKSLVAPGTDAARSQAVETAWTNTNTDTNWKALESAGVVPVEIKCDGYAPVHYLNVGCHTRLLHTAAAMIRHWREHEHGGGFVTRLKRSIKVWPGWKDLHDAGVEASDFRCEVCDAVMQFHTGQILKHMKAHLGKNRRIAEGGQFNFTLSSTKLGAEEAQIEEDADLY